MSPHVGIVYNKYSRIQHNKKEIGLKKATEPVICTVASGYFA